MRPARELVFCPGDGDRFPHFTLRSAPTPPGPGPSQRPKEEYRGRALPRELSRPAVPGHSAGPGRCLVPVLWAGQGEPVLHLPRSPAWGRP